MKAASGCGRRRKPHKFPARPPRCRYPWSPDQGNCNKVVSVLPESDVSQGLSRSLVSSLAAVVATISLPLQTTDSCQTHCRRLCTHSAYMHRACHPWLLQALEGSVKALLRLCYGSVKALLANSRYMHAARKPPL